MIAVMVVFVLSLRSSDGSNKTLADLLHPSAVMSAPESHEVISGVNITGNLSENLHRVNEFWQHFKESHGKQYNRRNDKDRRKVWMENILLVHQHNEDAKMGKHSYFLKANHLSDMNVREYMKKMTKLTQGPRDRNSSGFVFATGSQEVIPEELNWIKEGFVTPTLNQKNCGSCYAFSVASSAAGQHFRNTKEVLGLSPQQLVDCSTLVGNLGCNGGSIRNALKYLTIVGGLMSDDDYPYSAKQGRCHYNILKRSVDVASFVILPEDDEEAIRRAVATVGPVACSLDASLNTFQLYSRGIYDDESCSSNRVNHAMLIVGYTEDAWILKNWWGTDWGINGYMYLRRGVNRCSVGKYAGYPVLRETHHILKP